TMIFLAVYKTVSALLCTSPFVRGSPQKIHGPAQSVMAARKPALCSFEERRIRSTGDVADFTACLIQHLVAIARDAAIYGLQSHQRARESGSFGLFQRRAPDEIFLFHLAESVQSGFPHIDGVRNLMSVERHLAFQ